MAVQHERKSNFFIVCVLAISINFEVIMVSFIGVKLCQTQLICELGLKRTNIQHKPRTILHKKANK